MLWKDEVQDKILTGQLRREDCNNKKVFQFLRLLKMPRREQQHNYKEITTED